MPTQSSSNRLDPAVTYEENQAPNWLGGEVAVGVGNENTSISDDFPTPSKNIIASFVYDFLYTSSPDIISRVNSKTYPRHEVLSWLKTTAAAKDSRISRAITDNYDDQSILKLIEECFLFDNTEGNNLSPEKREALLQALKAEQKDVPTPNSLDLNLKAQITNAEKVAADRIAKARLMATRQVDVINPIANRVLASIPSTSDFSQSIQLADLERVVDQAVTDLVSAKNADSNTIEIVVAKTLAQNPLFDKNAEIASVLAKSLEENIKPKLDQLNREATGIARALQNQGYDHQDASEIAEAIVYTDPHPLIKGSLSSFKQPNYREIWKKWGKSDLQAEQSQRKFEQLRTNGYSALTAVVEAGRSNDPEFEKIIGNIPDYSQQAARQAYQQLQSNIQDLDRSRTPVIPLGRNRNATVVSIKVTDNYLSRDEINSILRTEEISPKFRKILTASDREWKNIVKSGAIPLNRIAQLNQMRENFSSVNTAQLSGQGNRTLMGIRGALKTKHLFNFIGGAGKQLTSQSGVTVIQANAAELKHLEAELGTVLTGTDFERHEFYERLSKSGQLSRWARPSVIIVKSDADNSEMVLVETTNRGNIVYRGPLGWARTQVSDWTTAAGVYLAEGSNNLAMADGFGGRIGGWVSTGLDKLGVKGAIGGFLGNMKSKLLTSGLGKIAGKLATKAIPVVGWVSLGLDLLRNKYVQYALVGLGSLVLWPIVKIISAAISLGKALGIGAAKTGAVAGEVIRNASGTTTITGTGAGGGGSSFGGSVINYLASPLGAPVISVGVVGVTGIFAMHVLTAAFVLPPYGSDSGFGVLIPDYATEFICPEGPLPEGFPTGLPFDGSYYVTACPGMYPSDSEYAGKFHGNSVDFGMDGVNIKSTIDGTVVEAGWNNSGYGNVVKIQSSNNKFVLIFAHLEEGTIPKEVYVGATVKKGQLLGKSDSSGEVTGPHIHYELKFLDTAYGNISIWCGISPNTECYVGANP